MAARADYPTPGLTVAVRVDAPMPKQVRRAGKRARAAWRAGREPDVRDVVLFTRWSEQHVQVDLGRGWE